MQLTVHAVLVPPFKCGLAYAHTPDKRCVTFTGSREAMIDLCDQVKAYNRGLREQVCVSADDWQGLAYVQPDECPAHWPTAA